MSEKAHRPRQSQLSTEEAQTSAYFTTSTAYVEISIICHVATSCALGGSAGDVVGISGESEMLVPMVNAFLDDVPPTTPELF
jgi:hypothetical protein